MSDIDKYAIKSGYIIDESGESKNIVTILGGGTPVSEKIYNTSRYSPNGGRVLGEDGKIYNLVDLLQNVVSGEGSVADGAVTTAKIADGAVTDVKLANPKVNKSGDTMSGNLALQKGISFGQQVGSSAHDLSKHIDMWGGVWGINVTSGQMNFNTSDSPSNSKFMFYHGTELIAEIQQTVTDNKALTTKEYVEANSAKSKLGDINPIGDPTTATTEDIANKINEILTALKA